MAFSGIFAVFVISCSAQMAWATMMTVNPSTFVPGVTPNVTMTCDPDGAVDPANVQEMILIEITKGEVVVAVVRPTGVPRLDSSLRTNKYSATGLVDNDNIGSSFLTFQILYPDNNDVGVYQCIVSYMDMNTFVQKVQEDVTLSANTSNTVDVQKQLEITLQTVNNLMARVNTLEAQVFNVSKTNADQAADIHALKEKAQGRIGFYATLNDKLDVHLNDVIVFSEVQLNAGDGYNSTSGVFVPPVSGLYVFSLVFEVEAPTAVKMEVALQVGSTVISRLFVYGEASFHGEQASGSVVYQVDAGSEVKPVVTVMSMETESQPRLVNAALSYFAGFLV